MDISFWFAEPKAVHVQGGIEKDFFGWGNTTLYGEWARFESSLGCSGCDYELDFWGLGVVQSIDSAAMDRYLSYRNYDADGYDNIEGSTIVGGAIIRLGAARGRTRHRRGHSSGLG